jgi:hypothetical protein
MHRFLGELFFLSSLEKGRTPVPVADPRKISSFEELNEEISHSLKAPTLMRMQTSQGTQLKTPVAMNRPFEDENLLKKLIQYRSQIPLSHRVIRNSKP